MDHKPAKFTDLGLHDASAAAPQPVEAEAVKRQTNRLPFDVFHYLDLKKAYVSRSVDVAKADVQIKLQLQTPAAMRENMHWWTTLQSLQRNLDEAKQQKAKAMEHLNQMWSMVRSEMPCLDDTQKANIWSELLDHL